jgi:polysaccharide biosynthesis protein PslH
VAGQSSGADDRAGAGVNGEILFLAHRLPFPPDRGDKIRSWNILKSLAKIAPVHVAALLDPADKPDEADELHALAASLTLAARDRSKLTAMGAALLSGGSASVEACASWSLLAGVKSILATKPVTAVYAFSGQMAQFVPHDLGERRFVMDFVDMDSAKFEAFSGFANRQEAKRLFAFEKATAQRADLSLFVSDAEAEVFRAKSGLNRIQVQALENGIDLTLFHPEHAGRAAVLGQGPLIVFTGQMDYQPNVDAVIWFANQVMPRLGPVRFAIVGRAPTPRVMALSALPGVTVTGEVSDTRDWIASADLVVAPLLLARGIQNKVLEAMAMGKAVLASPAAAEGIDAEADRDLLVADDAEAQALAIVKLLADTERSASIGKAARARMEARYSWDARMAPLPGMMGMAA